MTTITAAKGLNVEFLYGVIEIFVLVTRLRETLVNDFFWIEIILEIWTRVSPLRNLPLSNHIVLEVVQIRL